MFRTVTGKATEGWLIGHSLPTILFIATSQLSDKHNCYLSPVCKCATVLKLYFAHLFACKCPQLHQHALSHGISAKTLNSTCRLWSLLPDGGNLPRAAQHLSTAEHAEKSKMCRLHVSCFPEATGSNNKAHQQILTKRSDTITFSGTENKTQMIPVIPLLSPLETLCDSWWICLILISLLLGCLSR